MDKKTQATKLKEKIAMLDKRQSQTEHGLTQARAELAEATARRSKLVSELSGADAATVGFLEDEIDGLDNEIRSHERFVESAQIVLAQINAEAAPLRAELVRLDEEIRREERAGELRAFDEQMKQRLQVASDCLAAARIALADLNSAATRGAELYGSDGQRILDALLEGFVTGQAPSVLEQSGWRQALPRYWNMQFIVAPMVRG